MADKAKRLDEVVFCHLNLHSLDPEASEPVSIASRHCFSHVVSKSMISSESERRGEGLRTHEALSKAFSTRMTWWRKASSRRSDNDGLPLTTICSRSSRFFTSDRKPRIGRQAQHTAIAVDGKIEAHAVTVCGLQSGKNTLKSERWSQSSQILPSWLDRPMPLATRRAKASGPHAV